MSDCTYCAITAANEPVGDFGISLRELPASWLILFREQSHRGRCILAAKAHVDDISDLSAADSAAFMADVRNVTAALHKAFSPDKINFGAYGDKMHHLHFHLVPKYADDPFEWGDVFAMNPQRTTLSDEEYAELGAKLLAALDEVEA